MIFIAAIFGAPVMEPGGNVARNRSMAISVGVVPVRRAIV